MALFNFGRKKEAEKQESVCCCGATAGSAPAEGNCCCGTTADSAPAEQTTGSIAGIKVLGAGCKSCHELYRNAQAAAQALGLNVEVEYVTDMEKVMAYGAMSMPALVVNGRVVSMGRVLKPADVEKLLRKLGA